MEKPELKVSINCLVLTDKVRDWYWVVSETDLLNCLMTAIGIKKHFIKDCDEQFIIGGTKRSELEAIREAREKWGKIFKVKLVEE